MSARAAAGVSSAGRADPELWRRGESSSLHVQGRLQSQMHVHRRFELMETGMQVAELSTVTWRKSRRSNPYGDCVELARLASGEIAVRNSRDPSGPALIYTRAEIEAFIGGAKDGDFDDLIG